MKKKHSRKAAIALAVLFGAALTGCGKSNSAVPPQAPGFVPGANGYGGGGGCAPLTGQLGFTGQGVKADSSNILAGMIPEGYKSKETGQHGQVAIGGGGAGPLQGYHSDGSITMNLTPASGGYGGGGGGGYGQANISGSITISQNTLSNIVGLATLYLSQNGNGGGNSGGSYGGYNPYTPGTMQPGYQPQGYNQNVCANGLSMDLGIVNLTYIYGHVYLYIGGIQRPYDMYL